MVMEKTSKNILEKISKHVIKKKAQLWSEISWVICQKMT